MRCASLCVAALTVLMATDAYAEDTVKIGVNAALTVSFVSAGNISQRRQARREANQ